jgi:hypothetical protein
MMSWKLIEPLEDGTPVVFVGVHAQSELDNAVAALKQALPQWVSIEDRLPEEDGEYLVYVKWLNSLAEWVLEQMLWNFEDGKWGEDEDVIITHWMPLPPPPESEE